MIYCRLCVSHVPLVIRPVIVHFGVVRQSLQAGPEMSHHFSYCCMRYNNIGRYVPHTYCMCITSRESQIKYALDTIDFCFPRYVFIFNKSKSSLILKTRNYCIYEKPILPYRLKCVFRTSNK